MDRFEIAFPTGERLDFTVSKLEQEQFNGGHFPLFGAIKGHIKRHGKETNGAKIYEVMQEKGKSKYIHLTTFNE